MGTITRYVLLVINIGLGLLLMPFTIRRLGRADYGLWMLVTSLTYYFQLLDLGYGSSVVKQVTEADAKGDSVRINQVLSTFVVVYGALGLLTATGIAALMLFVVPRFPNIPMEKVWTARALLAIMGARIAVGFPMAVFGAAATARQRFALNNSVAIAVTLISAAVTYRVLESGHGLVTLVACTTSVNFAGYAAYAWTAKRALPALSIRPSLFSRDIVREVSTLSVYFFMIDIAVQIGFNLDNVVIGGVIGTTAVAVYSVALRLADYQRQVGSQFNSLLFPVVVRFRSAGNTEALQEMLIEGTRIALALMVGVTICLIGFARPLILIWMGPDFEASIMPLYVLGVTGVFLVGQGPLSNVLLATGRHRLVAFCAVAEALINLGLSLVLVRPFGIVGVAVGTAAPVIAASALVLLPAACRATGVSVTRFLGTVGTPAVVGAVPAILVCEALRVWTPPRSMAAVIIQGGAVGVVYCSALLTGGLSPAIRARYAGHLRRLLPF